MIYVVCMYVYGMHLDKQMGCMSLKCDSAVVM